jgi:hypothetical protein
LSLSTEEISPVALADDICSAQLTLQTAQTAASSTYAPNGQGFVAPGDFQAYAAAMYAAAAAYNAALQAAIAAHQASGSP